MKQIRDPFDRRIYNLRVSVNKGCNFNCFFCHEEGLWKKTSTGTNFLSPKEIETMVEVLTKYGINEVKITGGEPLLRKEILDIVHKIASIDEIEDLSMTSNGFYLEKFAPKLQNAGLDRINVSLNSLDPDTFAEITQTKPESLAKVIKGIKKAKNVGLEPVKVNFVALKNINIDEIPDIVTFAKEHNLKLHLIEYHAPNEDDELYQKYYYPLDDLMEKLETEARNIEVRSLQHRKQTILQDGTEAEFIRPMANPEFCENCHRIRITADGKFKPCLMRTDNHVDFTSAFEAENPSKVIKNKFFKAIENRKPHFS